MVILPCCIVGGPGAKIDATRQVSKTSDLESDIKHNETLNSELFWVEHIYILFKLSYFFLKVLWQDVLVFHTNCILEA